MNDSAVLVVDDDAGMREFARARLEDIGVSVVEADSAEAAMAVCRSRGVDLALIDMRLPDMSGLDLVRRLRAEGRRIRFVLMSGWLTIPTAVEAMRLGAVDAVSLPFDIEAVVRSALTPTNGHRAPWPALPLGPRLPAPRSARERWAWFVLRACDSEHDLKTVREWAAFVGVSYSGLTEICRLVRIRLHDARDFARILRVLLRNAGRTLGLDLQLNVYDHRTLQTLLGRARLDAASANGSVSLAEFLRAQQFIDSGHEALHALASMIDSLSARD